MTTEVISVRTSKSQCLKPETSTSCDKHQLLGGRVNSPPSPRLTKTTRSSAQNYIMTSLPDYDLSFRTEYLSLWARTDWANSHKWMGLIASSLPLSTVDMMFVSVRTRNKLLVQQKKKPLSIKCKVSLMLKGRTKMTEWKKALWIWISVIRLWAWTK